MYTCIPNIINKMKLSISVQFKVTNLLERAKVFAYIPQRVTFFLQGSSHKNKNKHGKTTITTTKRNEKSRNHDPIKYTQKRK